MMSVTMSSVLCILVTFLIMANFSFFQRPRSAVSLLVSHLLFVNVHLRTSRSGWAVFHLRVINFLNSLDQFLVSFLTFGHVRGKAS